VPEHADAAIAIGRAVDRLAFDHALSEQGIGPPGELRLSAGEVIAELPPGVLCGPLPDGATESRSEERCAGRDPVLSSWHALAPLPKLQRSKRRTPGGALEFPRSPGASDGRWTDRK
jgi:hypothetical protein